MSELDDVCEKLLRDAGARKVMVCTAEGEMLAHAGALGSLDDPTSDAVATLVAEVMAGSTQSEGLVRMGALSASVATVSGNAALVVLFEEAASAERVRQKMRRARDLLEKSLPGESKSGETIS
jgi:hypothetical protein